MFEELLSEFTSSQHGQQAIAALQQQGIPADQAASLIENALPTAAASFTQQTADHPEPKVGCSTCSAATRAVISWLVWSRGWPAVTAWSARSRMARWACWSAT